MKVEPLQVSWAWMAGLAPIGWDAAFGKRARDFADDPRWFAWWDSLGVGGEVFAAIYVEDRQKISHRVKKSGNGISISLGVPAHEARAANDLRAYMRTQEFNLWHRAADKLNWPKPPNSEPVTFEDGDHGSPS